MTEQYDVAIVGAGPAGLSAALYTARFCRSTLVVHDNSTRAARIPLTHNAPGFDEGVSGTRLLARMRRHAERYGTEVIEGRVDDVARRGAGFRLTAADGRVWDARAVILATGVETNLLSVDGKAHDDAVAAGVLRYCPICDGYEHRGQRIAVVGCDVSGAAEALFLKSFSDDVTLLTRRDVELGADERRDLDAAGVRTETRAVAEFLATGREMRVRLEGEDGPLVFDVVYPALGSQPRSQLAHGLGLAVTADGKLGAGTPFGSEVPGVFAAGDVVEGLDQISVAMGHGAIVATKAHNWLRARDGETVEAVLGEQSAA